MRIIGYSSIDRALVLGPELRALDISGEVALTLGRRGCAGRWEGDRYVPCDRAAAPFCEQCGAAPDPCVLCRGECLKPEKTCLEEHSVYLAVFSPGQVKVGVSKARRLDVRLYEQGADVGLEIARLPDGATARKMERSLSAVYRDRVSFEDKIAPGAIGGIVDRLQKDHGVIRKVRFQHFLREPWMRPIVIKPAAGTAIVGKTFGIKGQALVLENRGSLYAVNLEGLVGYEVQIKRGAMSLQSSLHSY